MNEDLSESDESEVFNWEFNTALPEVHRQLMTINNTILDKKG
jgi:hypothetical protein